ncbi:unnamed protein product [Orchesella dallaii]|uniref:F-box domain-containing protein n=1 Tax=Orchesella dallaii TaxID=48710 RepID=A0ABP1RJ87_9HEXA
MSPGKTKRTSTDPKMEKENLTGIEAGEESESGDDSQRVAPFVADNVREKIWLNIFDKLAPEDKVTFLTTSPEWHKCAAPNRTLVFFNEIASMLLETLPKHAFLQCRQVCRQWTKELDEHYNSHPDHLRFAFEKERILDGPPIPQYITRFETVSQVRKFMEENRSHPGNPFPGRIIYLRWKDGSIWKPDALQLFQGYWKGVGEMLLQFGRHIHFAIIHIFERDMETYLLERFEIVRNYLMNLPHLKRLKFLGPSRARLDEVREFLGTNSLPQLADLETLELCGISPFWMDAVLNFCTVPSKIKRLCFDLVAGDYGANAPNLHDMLQKFTNLEALELTNLTEDYERFGHLRSLGKLTHLSLGFCEGEIREAKPFFEVLEPFGRTLTHLKIKCGLAISNSVRTPINLPHLERLHIAEYKGNLDPLLQLTSLTFLRIDKCIQRTQDKKIKSAIDVYGFEKRMYQSNIWKVMPTLQTIIIRKRYDRQTYEKLGNK